ncbi:hypothetical protein [Kitasatospora sp. NBC_01539]
MIVTVTPDPAPDTTCTLPSLRPHTSHRADVYGESVRPARGRVVPA